MNCGEGWTLIRSPSGKSKDKLIIKNITSTKHLQTPELILQSLCLSKKKILQSLLIRYSVKGKVRDDAWVDYWYIYITIISQLQAN